MPHFLTAIRCHYRTRRFRPQRRIRRIQRRRRQSQKRLPRGMHLLFRVCIHHQATGNRSEFELRRHAWFPHQSHPNRSEFTDCQTPLASIAGMTRRDSIFPMQPPTHASGLDMIQRQVLGVREPATAILTAVLVTQKDVAFGKGGSGLAVVVSFGDILIQDNDGW
jgi:hypothetical protein